MADDDAEDIEPIVLRVRTAEQAYVNGSRSVWIKLLADAIQALGPEFGSAHGWALERDAVLQALAPICTIEADIFLGDVVTKAVEVFLTAQEELKEATRRETDQEFMDRVYPNAAWSPSDGFRSFEHFAKSLRGLYDQQHLELLGLLRKAYEAASPSRLGTSRCIDYDPAAGSTYEFTEHEWSKQARKLLGIKAEPGGI